ncbi:MAG TPA: hypothetical protein VF905_07405 [Nitrospirota bacterium]
MLLSGDLFRIIDALPIAEDRKTAEAEYVEAGGRFRLVELI